MDIESQDDYSENTEILAGELKLGIVKIKEEVLPNLRISRKGVEHLNSLLLSFMDRFLADSRELKKIERKSRAGTREISTSLKLMDYENKIIQKIVQD